MIITGIQIQQRLEIAPCWHQITFRIRDEMSAWTIPDQDLSQSEVVNNLTDFCCEQLGNNIHNVQKQTVWNFLRRWALTEAINPTPSGTGIELNCYLND
jgi:hypothetical protein